MKSALYFNGVITRQLSVLAENPDRTVELGLEDKTLIVGRCPVSTEQKVGHAVIGEAPEAAGDAGKKSKAPKADK